MKNWIRIFLVSFVLIGGTISFGYWSINRFNQAFDVNLNASYLANTYSVYPAFKQNAGSASTSPEISGELATSTGSQSSPKAMTGEAGQVTPTDPELSFTFPQKDTRVYIGCTYQISWQSSTTIHSWETALVDAGMREVVGPKTSGLAKENTIEKESQNLNWKVGFVWPGAYYIKISKINDVDTETRSKNFIINEMPSGSGKKEQKGLCEKTGGNLF